MRADKLRNVRLCAHHVGGRNGSGGFALPLPFADDLVNIYFEADQDAIRQIEEVQSKTRSHYRVLPQCLFNRNGMGVLHINFDPYSSSLLRLAERDDRHMEFYGFDYVYAQTHQTMVERPVELCRLDDIVKVSGGDIPPPDVLSIDTQGTEFEILEGGQSTIVSNTLAVVCEVEFLEIYKGEHTFGDISSLLDGLGFDFVDFVGLGRSQPYRQPLGMRGKRFTTAADALFFKRLNLIEDDEVALMKSALIAHVFNHQSFGFECLKRYEMLDQRIAVNTTVYSEFLQELQVARDAMPKLVPWTFNDLRSFENSRMRFDESRQVECKQEYERARRRYGQALLTQCDVLVMLLSAAETPIEATFRKYGLVHQADTIRAIRISNAQECCDVGYLQTSPVSGLRAR